MTKDHLLPSDEELYRRVYEIAHYLWDPIGIAEHPEAHDEYQGYLTALLNEAATRKIEYPVTRVLPLLSVEKG
jgi:hypothetical protein